MKKEITIKNFLWGYFWIFFPTCSIGAILVLIGNTAVNLNEHPTKGLAGAIVMLLYIPFGTLIFALLNWGALVLGLWIKDRVDSIFFKKKSHVSDIEIKG